PTVELNRVARIHGSGIEVSCAPGCTGSSVVRNSVADTFAGQAAGAGMFLTSDAAGMVVANNEVTRSMDVSYDLQGTSLDVRSNKAIDQGGSGPETCYRVGGNGGYGGHALSYNAANHC